MDRQKVVLLTTEGESGRIAARYLAGRFGDFKIVIEQPEKRSVFLRRRIKRLGLVTVAGQIVFMALQRLQQRRARARIEAILGEADLAASLPDEAAVHRVGSVNAPECIALLRQLDPAAVLVMGTRIIAPAVRRSVRAPFINYHAGITPKYRGVHGGYWALVLSDRGNFGATVHLVDEGIDSGGILYQARGEPAAHDNFSTYPYRQLALGLPLLAQAAEDALAGKLTPQPAHLPSQLWSHPTIWAYLANGLRRGVW